MTIPGKEIHIRSAEQTDLQPLIDLTLRAFEPIFENFPRVLGPELYTRLYPDWHTQQADGVRWLMSAEKIQVYVAEVDKTLVGLIAVENNPENRRGEVQFLAVDPEWQRQGIADALNKFALKIMRQAGMTLAIVETGGDSSHAPARRAYEKAGYSCMPIARYFQVLSPVDAAGSKDLDGGNQEA
jgi:ribosomal protein S18 acetylase RimI-like enzyme